MKTILTSFSKIFNWISVNIVEQAEESNEINNKIKNFQINDNKSSYKLYAHRERKKGHPKHHN